MAQRFVIRRGTKTQWETSNPVLAVGELAYNSTDREIRVGDGFAHWSDIAPIIGGQGLDGKSAYQQAVDAGFVGTEEQWLTSLRSTEPGPAGVGVPSGGSLGQILAKLGPDSYLTGWIDPPVGGGGGGGGNITSVNGQTGVVVLDFTDVGAAPLVHTHTKADVGLGNVDNTTDAGKPISIAQQNALDQKASRTGVGALRIWPASATFPVSGMQDGDLFPKIAS